MTGWIIEEHLQCQLTGQRLRRWEYTSPKPDDLCRIELSALSDGRWSVTCSVMPPIPTRIFDDLDEAVAHAEELLATQPEPAWLRSPIPGRWQQTAPTGYDPSLP